MELTCDACHATIHIPDARVPPHATFRVACPRCKQRIVVSGRRDQPAGESQGGEHTGEEVAPPSAETAEEMPEPFGPLLPGQRAALICTDDAGARAHVKSTLEGMGYIVDAPPTPAYTLQRLRFSQWHVVILDEGFGGASPNPVARYLEPLDMNTRREMFVVLVGERFKTSDHMQAFVNSVDLVLHPSDLSHLASLLERALLAHEQLYRMFNECLVAAGKKIKM